MVSTFHRERFRSLVTAGDSTVVASAVRDEIDALSDDLLDELLQGPPAGPARAGGGGAASAQEAASPPDRASVLNLPAPPTKLQLAVQRMPPVQLQRWLEAAITHTLVAPVVEPLRSAVAHSAQERDRRIAAQLGSLRELRGHDLALRLQLPAGEVEVVCAASAPGGRGGGGAASTAGRSANALLAYADASQCLARVTQHSAPAAMLRTLQVCSVAKHTIRRCQMLLRAPSPSRASQVTMWAVVHRDPTAVVLPAAAAAAAAVPATQLGADELVPRLMWVVVRSGIWGGAHSLDYAWATLRCVWPLTELGDIVTVTPRLLI
jgi:hypothetical protein